jgi:hypothetical protein
MHAAPPPTAAGAMRRTLYLTYVPARAFEAVGPGEAYNDVLLADGTGRVKHLLEAVSEQGPLPSNESGSRSSRI